MRDFITLGPVPYDEECEQIGTKGYDPVKARKQVHCFIQQLRQQFGPEPVGTKLKIKLFPHDFGSYYEAICAFDGSIKESVEYAFRVERELPAKWDLSKLGSVQA